VIDLEDDGMIELTVRAEGRVETQRPRPVRVRLRYRGRRAEAAGGGGSCRLLDEDGPRVACEQGLS